LPHILGGGWLAMEIACGQRQDRYYTTLPTLFACSQQEALKLASRANQNQAWPVRLSRSASGDCTYLELSSPSPGEIVVLTANRNIQRLRVPGPFWGLSDNLSFVAWRDGDGLRFATGELHVIPKLGMPSGLGGGLVGFTPGATHYYVARGTTTEIFASTAPGKAVATVELFARRIYSLGTRLYVFGHDPKSDEEREIWGAVYAIADGTLTRERDTRIRRPQAGPSPFIVVDVDPRSGTILCADLHDALGADWLVYDLGADTLSRLGPAAAFGAFLAPELVRILYGQLERAH
jgi:hypothetical protein